MPRSSSRLSAFVDNESIFAIPESDNSEKRRKVLDAQKSLHLHLKPEISKLCGILQFSVCKLIILLTTFNYIFDSICAALLKSTFDYISVQ